MTPTEIASASKTRLLDYIAQLEQEKLVAQQDTKRAIEYANYFGAVLSEIEKLLINSPFVNKDGKFFKTLFWVMSNISTIKKIIEDIVKHIKDWRSKVNELIASQPKPETAVNTPTAA